MKRLKLLLFVLFATTLFGVEQPDIISPKMELDVARALLVKHKAKSTFIQLAYPGEKTNRKLEHFILQDGRTIELSSFRKKASQAWIIKDLFEIVWINPGLNREKGWVPLQTLLLEEPDQSPAPIPPGRNG